MKSNICVNVEFLAGTSIEQAVIEATQKVSLWQVAYINFKFNGVNMSIGENTSVIEAVDKYHEGLRPVKDDKVGDQPIDPYKYLPKKNGVCKHMVDAVCKQHNLFCGFPKCDEAVK